ILLMIIGLAAVPIALIKVEVPLAVGTFALERATAPATWAGDTDTRVKRDGQQGSSCGGPVEGDVGVVKGTHAHRAGRGSSECPWVGYWGASLRQRRLR